MIETTHLDLFAVQREELRSRLAEATAARWSASEITRWLNLSAGEFQRKAKILTRNKSYSTVAAQQRYTLPRDYMEPVAHWFQPGILVRPMVKRTIGELLTWGFTTGDPQFHAINENAREDWVYPVPSAAAETTAVSGSLSATATTITTDDTTGFPDRGRVIIDEEVIYYTGITTTTFTGCVRGYEDTKAETHADDATVTWRDVEFSYYPIPGYRSIVYVTGTVATTYASTGVVGTSTAWALPNVKAGMFFGCGTMGSLGVASTTFPVKWYEIESVTDTTNLVLVDEFDEPSFASGSAYIITERTDIPERYCGAVVEIALLFSQMKDENLKEAPFWNARVMEIVKEALGATGLPADYLPVSRDNTGPMMGMPQYPSNYPLRYP